LPVSELSRDRHHDSLRLAEAVREGGALALTKFGGPLRSWTKDRDSPVTEADIAVNDLLLQRLRSSPEDGWLSEESENDPARLLARRIWVVDPIDGTRAFMAGREDWSISAALVEDGRPVAAAVYAPVTDELFVAVAGGGATRNGVAIRATAGSGIAGARISGPKRMLDRIASREPAVVVMPRVHSLALRIVRVAHSELDAALAGGNGADWDLAAADLLVHEAGGVMTALDGLPLIYNRPEPVHGVLLAAGRERFGALIDLVRAQVSDPA
jgi:myo-inositol-1(or 4)-monophosphatase